MRTKNNTEITTKRGMKIATGYLLAGLMIAGAGMAQQARGADQKPTVIVSLSNLKSEIYLLRENLSRTMGALEQVKGAAADNKDLAKPYEVFSNSYNDLEAQVASVRQKGTAAKARAKEHWEAWQKELTDMTNPKLREKAQKRYTATSGEFEKITEKVDAAKEVFAPLAADLKDISTYLKTDLSTEAVSSLSNTIWKMGNAAKTVDRKLGDVSEQIEKTMKKMPQT